MRLLFNEITRVVYLFCGTEPVACIPYDDLPLYGLKLGYLNDKSRDPGVAGETA